MIKKDNWYISSLVRTAPKIHVLSLDSICAKLPEIKEFNIISIRDSSNKKKESLYNYIDKAGLPNLLIMFFDDLSHENESKYGTIPTENHLSEIIGWAKSKWSENHKDFFIHCTAGISRSSAVATVLNTMFQGMYAAMAEINPKIHYPNKRILEIGEKLINSPGLEKEISKMYQEYNREFKYDINNIF